MARSVDELRRESESNRAQLTTTVDQLRDQITETAVDIRNKVSPQHIKSEVSEFISTKTLSWVDSLKQQAKENPMQAVVVGTAVAVPALRVARGLSLPLLMIGAGLALSSKSVRERAAEAAPPAMDKAREMMGDAVERAQEVQGDVLPGFKRDHQAFLFAKVVDRDAAKAALAKVEIKSPAVPLIANVLASPISDPEEIRRCLVQQVTGTVRWRECVARMAADGVATIYEIGSGKVLAGLAKRIAPALNAASIGTPQDIEAALPSLMQ